MWICGFLKIWKLRSKKWKEPYANVVDLWILDMYSSNGSLSLETLITQFDMDLWIFEIQYINTIKLKETGHRTQGICGFFYVGLLCVIALVAQNDVDCGFLKIWSNRTQSAVDLWIFYIYSYKGSLTYNTLDLWTIWCWSFMCNCISSAKWYGYVDFWKYENQCPKSQSNRSQNAVDFWIFYIYSSQGSLSLKSSIAQIKDS